MPPQLETTDFDHIYQQLKGASYAGKFRFQGDNFTFKNNGTGKVFNCQGSEIESMQWQRRCKGFGIRVFLKSGQCLRYEGFNEKDLAEIEKYASKAKISFDKTDIAIKGFNWGSAAFKETGNVMDFNVGEKFAFDIPLSNVSNCQVGKNEVHMQFHPNEDAPIMLSEMRFHITDHDGVTLQNFKDNVLKGADVIQATGDVLASFAEVSLLTPRGRYDIDIFPRMIHFHGKSFDYKIPFDQIFRMFLVPHRDKRQMFMVLSLETPVVQGQTRYPRLVLLFQRDVVLTDTFSIRIPDEIEEGEKSSTAEKNIRAKLLASESKLKKSYAGRPEYECLSDLLRILTGHKMVGVSSSFYSDDFDDPNSSVVPCLDAAFKSNVGLLYPMPRGFLFLPRPPVYIRFDEIACLNFARSASATKSFDFEIETKNDSATMTFSNLDKNEYSRLFDFVKTNKLHVKNTGGSSAAVREIDEFADDSDESEDSDAQKDKKLMSMGVSARAAANKATRKNADEIANADESSGDESGDETYNPKKDKTAKEPDTSASSESEEEEEDENEDGGEDADAKKDAKEGEEEGSGDEEEEEGSGEEASGSDNEAAASEATSSGAEIVSEDNLSEPEDLAPRRGGGKRRGSPAKTTSKKKAKEEEENLEEKLSSSSDEN